ncbi:MAG: hypothetical protein AAF614_41885 [Chloroflexota bacterium]
MKTAVRSLILLWLAWAITMLAFQAFITARIDLERPDNALFWTGAATTADANAEQIYLNEPFLNNHVAWDSEYYLSIATVGYLDSAVRSVQVTAAQVTEIRPGMNMATITTVGDELPLNFAFLPFYPLTMRVLSWPLRLFGLNTIATATLAGVIVSMLGTLGGMLALYDLTKDELGERGGIRTAFYLIIFPSGMFLAQVYTEGLFVGLAFGALALTRRKQWGWAAALAVCATLTRAVGVALFIPLITPWLRSGDWMDLDLEWRELYFRGVPWRAVGRAFVHLSPIIAFLAWRFSFYGLAFGVVEEVFFGRGAFMIGTSFVQWLDAFREIFGDNGQASTYYLIEFGAIILGFWSCFATRKQYPALSWYGLLAIFIALTSGPAQGMHRYILAAPSIFIFLSRLGKSEAFDRAWTVASVLLMGLLTTLFSFDFWVG